MQHRGGERLRRFISAPRVSGGGQRLLLQSVAIAGGGDEDGDVWVLSNVRHNFLETFLTFLS
jgi:hypothetical protein